MKSRKEKYADYRKTEDWILLRDFARYRNKKKNNGILTCDDCGTNKKGIYDVHHLEYPFDLRDDNPKYHIVLCRRCHGIAHNKIELSEKEKKKRDDVSTEYMKQAMAEMLKTFGKGKKNGK